MRYFLPDSCDTVDPTYNFAQETRSVDRQKQNDLYCHEVLTEQQPYNGILISYGMVMNAGRYSTAARRRLLRSGVREFFRAPKWLEFMGDPGAFAYFKEDAPPFAVEEVAEFYAQVKIDFGLAVDHIVPGFTDDDAADAPTPEARRRYDLTLELNRSFLAASKPYSYTPVGVVQGWSPASFAAAAKLLQAQGYQYLALGGLVRLKTSQLLRVLKAVDSVRAPGTKLHLLGVTRPGNMAEYVSRGVASLDSTSPLRRAWMDQRHNYFDRNGKSFAAIRVPPSTSVRIRSRLGSGEIHGETARVAEARALAAMAAFDAGLASVDTTLAALLNYQAIHTPVGDRAADYRRTLEAAPWKHCGCSICTDLGHHVVLLRGAERNRRRGFHNVGQFNAGLMAELAAGEPT